MATLELTDNDVQRIADALAAKLMPLIAQATKGAGNKAAKAAAGEVMTLAEAAAKLGISVQTARRMANAGTLAGAFKANTGGGHWKVRRGALQAAIRQNRMGTEVREV